MENRSLFFDFDRIEVSEFKTGCSDNDTFSDALKRYQKEIGITTEKLAELSGISQSTLTRYRAGNVIPEMRSVIAICIALEIVEEEKTK